MAKSLFITGASGFLGRHFLAQLERAEDGDFVCLSRQPAPVGAGRRARWLRGDVLDPASYRSALGPESTVVHLAGVTGKASRNAYRRVNTEGTRTLLAVCAERGVRRFILVSSVAARYSDLRSYPYGASKREAEQLVQASGLSHLIVRPTVVLGAESPIWQKLRQLAGPRFIPVIGNGRTRLQPIHVRDVAVALSAVAADPAAKGTFELAGPETISIWELLQRIHALISRTRPTMIPIPYAPLRAVLGALEGRWSERLPVTAGQLSLFVNDSTIQADSRLKAMWPEMMGVDEMIRASESGNA